MAEGMAHNSGEVGRPDSGVADAIRVRSQDLPRVITLELEDGSRKEYRLVFAKTARGLILNKAI